MRWLFLLLLAANIIFFFWNWLREDDAGSSYQQETAFSSKGKTLVLLSELEPASTIPPPVKDKPSPADSAPIKELPPAAAEQRASKPATIASRTSTASSSPPSLPTEQKGGLCYVLGPFTSSAKVQQVISRIANSSALVEKRWSSPQQRTGYWVHIPPAASSKKARDTAQKLNAAGFADAQPITSGEMKNAVSLGIFSTRESARKRLARVKKHNRDTVINEVRIRKRQYWLALRDDEGKRLLQRMLNGLIRNERGVKVEQRPCTTLHQ